MWHRSVRHCRRACLGPMVRSGLLVPTGCPRLASGGTRAHPLAHALATADPTLLSSSTPRTHLPNARRWFTSTTQADGTVASSGPSSSLAASLEHTTPSAATPDDLDEPDVSRQDAMHAHDAAAAGRAEEVPMQGLDLTDASLLAVPPFASDELAALVADLKLFQEATAAHHQQHTQETTAPPPLTPTPSPTPAASSADASSIPASITPPPARPFLASWSVKEVCSWYLQVEEQLNLPTPSVGSGLATSILSFVALLQKHSIDGARLLAFTTESELIPLISPQLLSRILYLSSLDTYSHMFQPTPQLGEDASSSADPNMRHLQSILHSTVKIFCTSTSPDFARPWAQLDQVDSTSSGFVISGRRILCNAHGATSATNIRVRKHGDATKYKATVAVISHEADLAILEVANEKFWRDLTPLQFGHVPRLQDTVIVVGYPTGGDSICVTKGVVSRILVSNYVHSDEALLTAQIDAAINSGNSGGPVLLNGKVVGVAFQGVSHAQSVGYIIPIPVVMHFLNDLQLHGRYTGFPSFSGLTFQKLENESLKRSFGLSEDETGIIVMSVPPLDGARNALQRHDVLTHVDGIPIADDGSIFFRHGERISHRYLPSSKFVGDTIKMRVVRDKKPLEVSYQLEARKALVPTHLYDVQPSYFILAGLVFTPLTRPYLIDTFGRNYLKRSPVDLITLSYYGVLEHSDEQVVILSTILVSDVNTGYGANFHNIVLVSINGVKIRNLKHMVQVIEEQKKTGVEFLRFEFTLNRLIILETELAFASTDAILEENNIEYDRSKDLRTEAIDTQNATPLLQPDE